MKKLILLSLLVVLINSCQEPIAENTAWIRVNQLGYVPGTNKTAVILVNKETPIRRFEIKDSASGKTLKTLRSVYNFGEWEQFGNTARLDFSDFNEQGVYYLEVGGIKSPYFKISNDAYKGTADFILKYMRQQRCGFNPYLKEKCHLNDGYVVLHPELDGKHFDVTGGWHDAADYLQYSTTSVNAIMQMLFAYQHNPSAYGDYYDAKGLEGANGIPDIIDEIKWGVDWMLKMNPSSELMFNQIADDRDHAKCRYPNKDSIEYDKKGSTARPIYPVTGEVQGLRQYKNRTTGVSSTAAKFSSAFALASKILRDFDANYADTLAKKAFQAYQFALSKPGVQQTACTVSPYFYEEENYVDDMALAAVQLMEASFDKTGYEADYRSDAIKYIREEPVTPWMGKDTARHYQYYPFVNLAHYYYAKNTDGRYKDEVLSYIRKGLDSVGEKAEKNPFYIGVPFIWCSNNLVSATITQARYYALLTGENTYDELEAAHRDWLFGCNPWGTSMIVGLPSWGDSPQDPHSCYRYPDNKKYSTPGGLVDGPVYSSIYSNLRGIRLTGEDMYAPFQTSMCVYHDDFGDYSTNEPTMDGTASLSFYLSSMECLKKKDN